MSYYVTSTAAASRWRHARGFTAIELIMVMAVVGILLAIARAAGETAPLLFTALGNRFWSTSLNQPMASLTVFIYDYAKAPFDDWNRQAWAAAFVLISLVFLVNIVFRYVTRSRYGISSS